MLKTSPPGAGGMGSIPVGGANIPRALRPRNQNIKQKQYCNKFNKNLKNFLGMMALEIGKEKNI